MAQGPSDTILAAIWITLRIRESKVRNPDPPDRRRFVLCECILVLSILHLSVKYVQPRCDSLWSNTPFSCRLFLVINSSCAKMASSAKPEVHNIATPPDKTEPHGHG